MLLVASRVAIPSHKEMNMNAKMVVAVVFAFPFGAAGAVCKPGYKIKATLTGFTCDSSMAMPSTCTKCCEKDATKCGGQASAIKCDAGKHVADLDKVGTNKTECCIAAATCADATCSAGDKKNAANSATKCSGSAMSCVSEPKCCMKDSTKCGGQASTITCDADTYVADKNTAGTDKAACCVAVKTCADATCTDGNKKNATSASLKCSGSAMMCMSSKCCEKDKTKCGGQNATIKCDAGTSAVAGSTVGTDKATCCKAPDAKITCDAAKAAPAKPPATGAATTGANTTSPATTSGVHSLMLLIGSIATMNF